MSRYYSEEVLEAVRQCLVGYLSPVECFCIVLSLVGEEETKLQFHNIIYKAGNDNASTTHKLEQLQKTYSNYFSERNEKNCDSTLLEQLDLKLALDLSISDTHLTARGAANYGDDHDEDDGHDDDVIRATENLSRTVLCDNSVLKNSYSDGNVQDLDRSCILLSQPSSDQIKNMQMPVIKQKSKKKKRNCNSRQQKHHLVKKLLGGPLPSVYNKPVIYWLRRDLRLHDNPALVAAFESNAPVVLAFLWNEAEEGPLATGGATRYWLHFALMAINRAVQDNYRNHVVLRNCKSCHAELLALVAEVGAGAVVMNNLYEPCLRGRDDRICAALVSRGIEVKRFDSYLLHTPESVSTESIGMRGLGSVTHFMECCRQSTLTSIRLPVDKPLCMPTAGTLPFSQPLDELELAKLPQRKDGTVIDWAKAIRENWDFSEDGAWKALEHFVEGGIHHYERESSRADMLNTSRISPYLHFGQISPRAVLRHVQGLRTPKFLRKLAWRDLSYWLLTKFPSMPSKPIRVHYQNQHWSQNKSHLKAWQRGKTGYPLVDASMRQLWLTGWLNNYMRHVVASFLISYLYLHWEHGYKWFQDTLLDADVAINAMMWQNGGMSGLDQWNFVMHPVDAALTCDPQGHFVRQWCPELSGLPDDYIHKPWKCPPSILRRAGVELGKTYPLPIITDLEEARERSLQDVVKVRLASPQFVDPHTGNDLVPLPSGLLLPVITRQEFKYKTAHPEAKDNPHTAVLRGYRSRKRDETVAFKKQVDFTASTLNECALRHRRLELSDI